MKAKTQMLDTNGIIKYLEKPDNFTRVERAYPDVDIDVALDLLRLEHHELNADVHAFLNEAIDAVSKNKKPKRQPKKSANKKIAKPSAKSDFAKTKISKKKWLAIQSARLGLSLVKFTGRAVIEKIPAATAGLTAAALLLGNLPDTDPNFATNQLCNNGSHSICASPDTIATMDHNDQKLLTAMMQTSTSEAEQSAISAIATASARTDVDFTFMLVFAQLESSLGKNLSTDGSTAMGIFQYVEGTWLESFKKHAVDFDTAYTDLADSIYFDSEDATYKTNPAELRDDILALRIDNPELHSFVNARDMQARDKMVLQTSLNALSPPSLQETFMQTAKTHGVEVGAAVAMKFYNDLRGEFGLETEQDRINQNASERRDTIVRLATYAYLDHFLGETGARRFLSVYEDTDSDLRHTPVGDLVGRDTPPISQWAIDANPGIFHDGDQTSVQVYKTIEIRVDAALQLIETRMGMAHNQSTPPAQTTDQTDNMVASTIEMETSKRPRARPKGLSPTQLAQN